MLSMAIQPGFNGALTTSSFPPSNLGLKPFKASIFVNPKVSSSQLSRHIELKKRANRRETRLSASAVAEEISTEDSTSATPQESQPIGEKLGVVVKEMEKARVVLKFIWMEKNIGIGLDQVIPGQGTIPLSPYYFWPRKDAWEELKTKLESKPWISQKRVIILLNQATDIINLWQQSGANLSS
ncbi:hypothetical protein HHK36_006963 [Tetracentron sinense]|uniref:30S ribosomal protein 3, chloroplastic n=1 Tax=Tetracentron sinense TaxID=13715 RepID=A0A834ZSN6_TETSI|nr:hypothetical protein HHK36_006963 [Tetracentron sinense]